MQEPISQEALYQLKFPIGEFVFVEEQATANLNQWINTIAQFPTALKQLTRELTGEQKNWIYRPEGWNIKQVVHHCADSHMNSLIRFKLSLTEDAPQIRPYYEDRWALLVDGQEEDLEDSFLLLTGLHNKWTTLLNALSASDLERVYVHPEHGRQFSLKEAIALYAWHCRHHLAHIQQAIQSAGSYN